VAFGQKTASRPAARFFPRSSFAANWPEDRSEDGNPRNETQVVTQRDVLTFFMNSAADGRAVTAQDLAREFWLSQDAAGGHLRRLWRERLLDTVSARPPRFRFRLEPGEGLHTLRFRITVRGRQRLRWYERHDDDPDGGWLGLR
jgi:hypothetical protein